MNAYINGLGSVNGPRLRSADHHPETPGMGAFSAAPFLPEFAARPRGTGAAPGSGARSRRTFSDERGHRAECRGGAGSRRGYPGGRLLLGPVLRRKDYLDWVSLGNAGDFKPGETTLVMFRNPFQDPWDGETANVPAYVRCSEDGKYTVFAINCAHLGCPVRWFSESQLFMCPCHGGIYYADGSRASGPPERGLFTYRDESRKRQADDPRRPVAHAEQSRRYVAVSRSAPATSPAIVTRIESCPSTGGPGTSASTIG